MINWIVTSSVLIVVVAGLRFVLRGKISLRLQYALWLVVLFRLLVPFDFGESSISMMNVVEQVPMVQEMESLENVESISYYEADGTVYGNRTFEEDAWPTVAVNQTEADFHRMEKELVLRDAADVVWKIGMAVMAFAFLFVNFRFKKRLERERKQIPVEDCRLPVYVSDSVETPCLFGLIQPAIYVTPEAASDETMLRHTIEHETTHYLQKDHIWSFLRCVALCLHWYNLLVWWAVKLSKEDGELACDEATIARIGEEERYAYGKTLIEMTKPGRNVLLGTATTMTGSKTALKERIERIAKKPKMAVYTLAAVIVIAVAAVVCTMTGAEKPPFESWLKTVKPTDISSANAYWNGGIAPKHVALDDEQINELCSLLNRVKKNDLSLRDSTGDSAANYLYLSAMDEKGSEQDYIFRVMNSNTIGMFFGLDTEELYSEEGRYWHIHSPELVSFIMTYDDGQGYDLDRMTEVARADLDGDRDLEVISVTKKDAYVYGITVSETDGTLLWEEEAGTSHTGWKTWMLYSDGGSQALVEYMPSQFTGVSTYIYRMFTLEGGKERLLEEGSVIFPSSDVEVYPPETAGYLENLNKIMEFCTILLSTEHGDVVTGPVSPQKLQWENAELIDQIQNTGSEPFDVVSAMQNVKASDFTNLDDFLWTTSENLAETLNQAAQHPITQEDAEVKGYDSDGFRYWYREAYTEGNNIMRNSGRELLHFEFTCGLAENIVQVTYGRTGNHSTAYFEDKDLYDMIRYRNRERIGEIDWEAYREYENLLVSKMEGMLTAMSESQPSIYGYELIEFHPVWEYALGDGTHVELYDFDYAMLCDDVTIIQFAGGMHYDGYLRLAGMSGAGQLAVWSEDGEKTYYCFMGNDFWFDPEHMTTEEDLEWVLWRLDMALDDAQENSQTF